MDNVVNFPRNASTDNGTSLRGCQSACISKGEAHNLEQGWGQRLCLCGTTCTGGIVCLRRTLVMVKYRRVLGSAQMAK